MTSSPVAAHAPANVPDQTVVIDTDAYSRIYLASGRHATRPDHVAQRQALTDALTGKTVVIAVQTRAEVLTFPVMGQFGVRRTAQVRAQIDQTPTIPVTNEVIEAWVQLTAACKRINHSLGQKPHAADRWVAATAIALGVPLLAVDGGYKDAPGLTLLPW